MDKEICEATGINITTFYRWKKKYTEFSEDLIKAKYKINADLEAAAFKRAIGYEIDEQETMINIGKNGEKVNKVKKIKKHIPADTKLLMALLRNRMPEKYKEEKQQIELTGELNSKVELQLNKLTDEELLKEYKKLGGIVE